MENNMDIKNGISRKVNDFIGNVIAGVVAGVIILVISWIFGNLWGYDEASDMRPPSFSSCDIWEVVEFPIMERDTSEERSHIRVERYTRCVSAGDSADGFHPDVIFLYEEIFNRRH